MFYYVYYDYDEEMPAGVIAAFSIFGLFGAVSCACCVRCKVKQSAWRTKLRRERWAKENGPSSTNVVSGSELIGLHTSSNINLHSFLFFSSLYHTVLQDLHIFVPFPEMSRFLLQAFHLSS